MVYSAFLDGSIKMKWFIRSFFKTVRAVVGPLLLMGDKLTTPRGVNRSAPEQQALDNITANLALYQFKTCPFCIKVRRHIKRLSLNIELRDARHNQEYRHELESGGGRIKVPCLRIAEQDSDPRWLYESDQIISYLDRLVSRP